MQMGKADAENGFNQKKVMKPVSQSPLYLLLFHASGDLQEFSIMFDLK